MEDKLNIDARTLRVYFFSVQIVNIVLSMATLLIIKTRPEIFLIETLDKKFTGITMSILLVAAFAFTTFQNRKLNKIQEIHEAEHRFSPYFKLYKSRMMWFLFSCIAVCLLGILTGRILFFYFAIVDVLMAIPYYPTAFLFRKELKNDTIELL